MDTATPQTAEGRQIAHRQVLSLILARLAAADASLLDTLERHSLAAGYDEDPGADPSPEFALEAAIADELRLILEATRRRMG